MNDLKTNYGPWALITGASSGIGKEFAMQLASKGFNLALAARSENKLEELSAELKQKYGIQTLVIGIDLTHPDFLKVLSQKTASLDIGLLVSNAGGYHFGAFLKSDLAELDRLLRLNTSTHMQLAHFYANKMKARGKGGILLVGSAGGFSSIPYMASYVASKAYVLSLGEALHVELRQNGIDVMVLMPGPTNTPGTMNAANIDNSKMGVSFMPVAVVVEKALMDFGKKVVSIPGGLNKFSYFFSKHLLPRMAMTKMMGKIMKKAMSPDIT